jgi:hypothetical protein
MPYLTVDLNEPADRAYARALLAIDDETDDDQGTTSTDGAVANGLASSDSHGELPSDVVRYVARHGGPYQQRMRSVLSTEKNERNAELLPGGEQNQCVRCALPGTRRAYAVVGRTSATLRLPDSYAQDNPLAHLQKHTYRVVVPFDQPGGVEEFHRLAGIAYQRRQDDN